MIRRLFAQGVFALALLQPSFASAEVLHGRDTDANCGDNLVDLRQWTPADGPAAAFVANAALDQKGTLFIALGFDDKGFWSVEDEQGWDGCDHDCNALYLVHTSFKGVRTPHLLDSPGSGGEEREKDLRATKRKNIKRNLFALAKGPWKVSELKHDYKLRTPAVDSDGNILKFTGWFAQVKQDKQPALRFALVNESHMCWCRASWRGYTLAEKKKK